MNITEIKSVLNTRKKLPQKVHKNMLELLKKMHAQDTFEKSKYELKAAAVCSLSTDTMKMNTCKIPVLKPNTLTTDAFVKEGQTIFKLGDYAYVEVENKNGKVTKVFDNLKKGWDTIKHELGENINFALKNYDSDKVQKHIYKIRTNN